MTRLKKSFTNPFSFSDYTSNSSDLYDYTMTNIMDNYYDTSTDQSLDGVFKAVVLSGMKDESNTGAGTDGNSAQIQGRYVFLTVRPLNSMGSIIPDPRDYDDPVLINGVISMHSKVFTARSDFEFTIQSPIRFGQIINCYYEKGSITNSNFRTLRFQEPIGITVEESYVLLGTKEGVQTLMSSFINGNTYLMGGFPSGYIDPRYPPRERVYKGSNPTYQNQVMKNGMLPADMMSKATGGGKHKPKILTELVPSYEALCVEFRKAFPNKNLSGSGYRTYEAQLELKVKKPKLAAKAGTSNHGWGQAIDVHYYTDDGKKHELGWGREYQWLFKNAPAIGWKHPNWAQINGSKPEPWHWEATKVIWVKQS